MVVMATAISVARVSVRTIPPFTRQAGLLTTSLGAKRRNVHGPRSLHISCTNATKTIAEAQSIKRPILHSIVAHAPLSSLRTAEAARLYSTLRKSRHVLSSAPSTSASTPAKKERGGLLGYLASLRLDLGLFTYLVEEWKDVFKNPSYFKSDIQAGITVACVAVPLSLAIAMGSGVPPEVGILTAIIGGGLASIFGGTPLAISGPAAALAFCCFEVVQRFGVEGLVLLTGMCGILQVLTGIFRLGGLGRFVPTPVIAGFTTGIGTMVLFQQLPVALDVPKPPSSHITDVAPHIFANMDLANPDAIALALGTVAVSLILPKVPYLKKIPATLFAVGGLTILNNFINLDVAIIGHVPDSLPPPRIPDFSKLGGQHVSELIGLTAVVYGVASVESLLSSSAVDKITRVVKRHDPDQELIGQGIANTVVALFGGMPVSSVIVRSSLNVNSGAKTRMAGLVQSATLIGVVYALSSYMSTIPLPVLSGVLLTVSIRMLSPHEINAILKVSKAEAGVWAVTSVCIVFLDVMSGVGAGMATGLLLGAIRKQFTGLHYEVIETTASKVLSIAQSKHIEAGSAQPAPAVTPATLMPPVSGDSNQPFQFELASASAAPSSSLDPEVDYLRLSGSVSFIQSQALSKLQTVVSGLSGTKELVVDVGGIKSADITGAEYLVDILAAHIDRGQNLRFVNVSEELEKEIMLNDHGHRLGRCQFDRPVQ